ncbi:hypothetical protein F7725_017668 [Dissostichus mawsoni]|uniref:Uncharacterized protein n=1 Tax=Dissostichus mawsoni TaxID=36200 RepID=A0A7J5Z5A0_DISMA|nr:hypothetical protein F7725_017668 [Dissostichus mawsoni]
MKQAGTSQDKWSQPGWRVEQKYANKVLLGNWAEDRLQGLPSKLLFDHHGPPSSHYLVTHYGESYQHTNALPNPRPLHPDSLTWQLERVNRPISGKIEHNLKYHNCRKVQIIFTVSVLKTYFAILHFVRTNLISTLPTNAGPPRSTKHRLEKQQSHLPSLTVYGSAYQRHPLSAFYQSRFARASRMLSSHLHPANHNNKDLDLRRHSLLLIPDHCLSQLQQSRQA